MTAHLPSPSAYPCHAPPQILHLHCNRLKGVIPATIAGCRSLEQVRIFIFCLLFECPLGSRVENACMHVRISPCLSLHSHSLFMPLFSFTPLPYTREGRLPLQPTERPGAHRCPGDAAAQLPQPQQQRLGQGGQARGKGGRRCRQAGASKLPRCSHVRRREED